MNVAEALTVVMEMQTALTLKDIIPVSALLDTRVMASIVQVSVNQHDELL